MKEKYLEESLSMTIKEWLHYHQNNIHFKQKYRGLNMIKNPFDLVIYEEILWELRPTVIIEVGNAFGGFSLWLHDRLRMIGVKKHKIITIDLKDTGDNNLKEFEGAEIVSIVGNCNAKKVLEEVRANINEKDVVLVIEDSAHTYDNTMQVLDNYKKIVTAGSYLIVEDGICDVLDLGINKGPMLAVENWILNNKFEYEIDRAREKYIMTYNPKGYIKRIS